MISTSTFSNSSNVSEPDPSRSNFLNIFVSSCACRSMSAKLVRISNRSRISFWRWSAASSSVAMGGMMAGMFGDPGTIAARESE